MEPAGQTESALAQARRIRKRFHHHARRLKEYEAKAVEEPLGKSINSLSPQVPRLNLSRVRGHGKSKTARGTSLNKLSNNAAKESLIRAGIRTSIRVDDSAEALWLKQLYSAQASSDANPVSHISGFSSTTQAASMQETRVNAGSDVSAAPEMRDTNFGKGSLGWTSPGHPSKSLMSRASPLRDHDRVLDSLVKGIPTSLYQDNRRKNMPSVQSRGCRRYPIDVLSHCRAQLKF